MEKNTWKNMTEVIKQRGNFNMIKNNNHETKGKTTTTTNKLKNLIEVMKQKENQKKLKNLIEVMKQREEEKKKKKLIENNQTKGKQRRYL